MTRPERRTDLRERDRHYSWKQVYDELEVEWWHE